MIETVALTQPLAAPVTEVRAILNLESAFGTEGRSLYGGPALRTEPGLLRQCRAATRPRLNTFLLMPGGTSVGHCPTPLMPVVMAFMIVMMNMFVVVVAAILFLAPKTLKYIFQKIHSCLLQRDVVALKR